VLLWDPLDQETGWEKISSVYKTFFFNKITFFITIYNINVAFDKRET